MPCCCGGGGGGGGGGGTLPGCFCNPIPTPLTMTSFSTTCNFGMFQSCTISYVTVGPEYADLDIGTHAFLSDQSFPDVIGNNALFKYILTCSFNLFNLSRVYASSPYGTPYRDGLLYSWILGGPGLCNNCSPTGTLTLTCGQAYRGSDSSCFVTIHG